MLEKLKRVWILIVKNIKNKNEHIINCNKIYYYKYKYKYIYYYKYIL